MNKRIVRFRITYAYTKHIIEEPGATNIEGLLLIGLDILKHHKPYADIVTDEFVCEDIRWATTLTRKLSYLYYEWNYDITNPKAELCRIHHNFYIPRQDRIT